MAELREAGVEREREMRYEIDRLRGTRRTGTQAQAKQQPRHSPSPLTPCPFPLPTVRAAAKKELEGRIAGVDLTQMECENTKVREMEVKVKEVEEGGGGRWRGCRQSSRGARYTGPASLSHTHIPQPSTHHSPLTPNHRYMDNQPL